MASPPSDSTDGALPERLARAIALAGPIPVSQFMAAANAHYYATRDPFGSAGDFVTAPEISQMFGELVGAALADGWARAGGGTAHYVELGPGRGTLAIDALRVMARAGLSPAVHLIETSPVLRAAQRERLPQAEWHNTLDSLPADGPLLIVANEFFDALPVRQIVRAADGWRERRVACQDVLFLPVVGGDTLDAIVPETLRDAAPGSVVETSPAAVAAMRVLARRVAAQGGMMLAIDYGYDGPAVGDTLQAVHAHGYANPFEAPGERDLTAHVDFGTLAAAARAEGAVTHGPAAQGGWLTALGIEARARALAAAHRDRGAEIEAARVRLTAPRQMGTLFKVLAVVAPHWPVPAGFAA